MPAVCECGRRAKYLAVLEGSDSLDAVQAVCAACATAVGADPAAAAEGWRIHPLGE